MGLKDSQLDEILDETERMLSKTEQYDELFAKSIVDLLRAKGATLKSNEVILALSKTEDTQNEDS